MLQELLSRLLEFSKEGGAAAPCRETLTQQGRKDKNSVSSASILGYDLEFLLIFFS